MIVFVGMAMPVVVPGSLAGIGAALGPERTLHRLGRPP